MRSSSKTNDGFEIIPFYTLLPVPDEEEHDDREREREGGRVRGRDREMKMCNASQNFFNFTDNFLCNY